MKWLTYAEIGAEVRLFFRIIADRVSSDCGDPGFLGYSSDCEIPHTAVKKIQRKYRSPGENFTALRSKFSGARD